MGSIISAGCRFFATFDSFIRSAMLRYIALTCHFLRNISRNLRKSPKTRFMPFFCTSRSIILMGCRLFNISKSLLWFAMPCYVLLTCHSLQNISKNFLKSLKTWFMPIFCTSRSVISAGCRFFATFDSFLWFATPFYVLLTCYFLRNISKNFLKSPKTCFMPICCTSRSIISAGCRFFATFDSFIRSAMLRYIALTCHFLRNISKNLLKSPKSRFNLLQHCALLKKLFRIIMFNL